MQRLQEVTTLNGHKERVWCVAWNPNGSLLASCSSDKTIRVWGREGEIWTCKSVLADAHSRTIRHIAWSPCGQYISAASFDATVSIWSRKAGEFECLATLEGHENEVKATSWARSGGLLATCSRDKSVWIWEVTADDDFECASVMTTHSQDVKRVKWHPSKDLLASCSYDDTVRLYREAMDDWESCNNLQGHESTVWSLDFNSTGSRIATSSDDKTVKIWQEYQPGNPEGISTPDDIPAWKCVCTLGSFHDRAVYDVCWSPLEEVLATAGGDDSICIFKEVMSPDQKNEPKFELVARVKRAHSQDINSVAWSPSESGLLASAGDDGDVRLWQLCKD